MLYYAPLLITAANSMTLNHILSTLQDIPLFYIYDASFVFAKPTIEFLFFSSLFALFTILSSYSLQSALCGFAKYSLYFHYPLYLFTFFVISPSLQLRRINDFQFF